MLSELGDMPPGSQRMLPWRRPNRVRFRTGNPSRRDVIKDALTLAKPRGLTLGASRKGEQPAARCTRTETTLVILAAFGALFLSGCAGISVEPSCPTELVVGEMGTLLANEKNEGAIAKYFWEVVPTDAGVIADADQPSATFEAQIVGKTTFRLTASDGLFQAISECSTEIIAFASIAVTLEVSPSEPVAGDTVTLTCTTGRVIPMSTRSIEQLDGEPVELQSIAEGVAAFTITGGEELSFRCVVESSDGEQAQSSLLTITVAASTDDQVEDGDDGVGDDDDNGNDNGADPTPRPPVRR